MLRFAALADIHFDLYTSQANLDSDRLTRRAHDIARAIKDVLEYCLNQSIKHVIIAGDIFEVRDKIPVPLFNLAYESLRQFKLRGINLYIIHGNHDQVTKGGLTHSLIPMQDIAAIFSKPGVCNISGYLFYMVPFKEGLGVAKDIEDLIESYSKTAGIGPKFLISHVGVKGALYNMSGKKSTAPTTESMLRPDFFTGVFLGDYHNHQRLGNNIWYCGAPVQHDFGDVGAKRGFLDVTYNDELSVEFVELKGFPKFHYIKPDKYKSGQFPEGDLVRLVGATRKQRKKFIDDKQVVGVKGTKIETTKTRISLDLDASWSDSITKYVNYLATSSTFDQTEKELITLGTEIISKVSKFRAAYNYAEPLKVRLKARNFMAFGSEGLEVDFSEAGRFLVTGDNRSSTCKTNNGAGKTNIFTALIYGLFGLGRTVKKSRLVNLETKKDCEVEVTLTFPDGRVAVVTRRIKVEGYNDGIYLDIDGKDERGASDIETQKRIVELVGMTKESFKTTVYMGSGDSDDNFASQQSADQNRIFSEILSLDDVTRALEETKTRLKDAKSDLIENQGTLERLSGKIDVMTSQIEKEKQAFSGWQSSQKQKLQRLEYELTEAMRTHRTYMNKVGDCEKQVESGKQEVVRLTEDFEKLNIVEAQRLLDKAVQNWEETNKRKTILTQDLSTLSNQVASLKKLHGEPVCTLCVQPLSEEHRLTVLANLQKQTKDIAAQHESVLQKLELLALEVKKCSEKCNIGKTLEAGVLAAKNRVHRLEAALVNAQTLESTQAGVVARLKTQREELRQQRFPSRDSLEELEDDLDDALDYTDSLEDGVAKIEEKIALLEFWVKGFGKSGLSNFLIEGVFPELNKLTAKYSDLLTNGETSVIFKAQKSTASKAVRNAINLQIDDLFGSDEYSTSSGGERRRINMITNLALFGLISKRNNMGFSVLDEAFVHLDGAGEKYMMKLFDSLTEDIPTLFVISNKESVMAEGFDKTYKAVREGRTSRLEVSNERD